MEDKRSYSPLYVSKRKKEPSIVNMPLLYFRDIKIKKKKTFLITSEETKPKQINILNPIHAAKFVEIESECLFSTGTQSREESTISQKKSFLAINNISNKEFQTKLLKNLEDIEIKQNPDILKRTLSMKHTPKSINQSLQRKQSIDGISPIELESPVILKDNPQKVLVANEASSPALSQEAKKNLISVDKPKKNQTAGKVDAKEEKKDVKVRRVVKLDSPKNPPTVKNHPVSKNPNFSVKKPLPKKQKNTPINFQSSSADSDSERSDQDIMSDSLVISLDLDFDCLEKQYNTQNQEKSITINSPIITSPKIEQGILSKHINCPTKLKIKGEKAPMIMKHTRFLRPKNIKDQGRERSFVSTNNLASMPTSPFIWRSLMPKNIEMNKSMNIFRVAPHRYTIENNVYSKLRKINSNKAMIKSLLIV
ncbi:hypothetical protein SteCoe_18287 [Stentor coeruleus]|uniref:Uncharacterized protein n=1 Tax=Stentor coeruleus TaxID=5963 RepID=A0A1R2BWV8_9CILI|nr:hypothetical protein SteCoe_18287 [Stentor coeruleus]